MAKVKPLPAIFLFPLLTVILFSSSCGSATTTVGVTYKPPFAPVTFTIDTNGTISVQGDLTIETPVGTFGLEANVADTLPPQDNTLLLIIRHKQPGKVVDDVYKIQIGQDEVRVVTNGTTVIDVTSHKVFIDASNGTIQTIAVRDTRWNNQTNTPPTLVPNSAPIPTPSPTPSPAPIPSPTPCHHCVVYRANWSHGLDGWTQSGGWSSVNGVLINSGLDYNDDGHPTVIAPSLPQDITDYSVKMEIRLDRYTDDGSLGGEASFGVVVRSPDNVGGYKVGACVSAGFFSCGIADHELLLSDGSFSQDEPVKQAPFRPAYGTWHTYRIDVQGSTIIVQIDGAVIFQVTDDKYLAAGSVGLWSDRSQLSVRNFTITAL